MTTHEEIVKAAGERIALGDIIRFYLTRLSDALTDASTAAENDAEFTMTVNVGRAKEALEGLQTALDVALNNIK